MARIVKCTENRPVMVENGAVCMCGLSKNKPHCDGSHRATFDEEQGKTYKYKEDGSREEVKE